MESDSPFSLYLNCNISSRLERHLIATAVILLRWDAPVTVCLAGLFHSIYGTESLSVATLKYEERKMLRNAIGGKAERLVYLFSVLHRTELFNNPHLEIISCICRRTDRILRINKETRKALLEIDAANHFELMQRIVPAPNELSRFAARLNSVSHLISSTAHRELANLLLTLPPGCFADFNKSAAF